MSDHHKLSLRSAILINLNVMVGFGVFVNTVMLSQLTGALGCVVYAIVALLITPLIMSVAALMRIHPAGGFYTYAAKEIHPLAGFVSAWVYFTGKLASAALIMHVSTTLLQQLIPLLQHVPLLMLDSIIIACFVVLNTLHLKIGSRVALGFIVLKLIPIFFAIATCLYLVSAKTAVIAPRLWSNIPASIPFVLYAFTGFEACCSISRNIEHADINGPRAIYLSFIIAVTINVLYQLLFFSALGPTLMAQSSYLGAFPSLLTSLLPAQPIVAVHATNIVHLAIATAALGGSYGILMSNHWNLFALAEHEHIPGAAWFTKLNKHHMPTVCVIVEGLLCTGYLVLTKGNQAPLQQINALACTIAYTLSVVALLQVLKRDTSVIQSWIPRLALISCLLFIGTCIRSFVLFGVKPLLAFSGLIGLGIALFALAHFQRHERQQTQDQ